VRQGGGIGTEKPPVLAHLCLKALKWNVFMGVGEMPQSVNVLLTNKQLFVIYNSDSHFLKSL
jgi:hypothetical protein